MPRHAAEFVLVEIDEAAQAYIDGIAPAENRALFDRIHGLIAEVRPDASVVLSYKMPTYVVGGEKRLHVAAWKHGVSLYGWDHEHDGGFAARHPHLDSGRGTLRIGRSDAAEIGDDELRTLLAGVLAR